METNSQQSSYFHSNTKSFIPLNIFFLEVQKEAFNQKLNNILKNNILIEEESNEFFRNFPIKKYLFENYKNKYNLVNLIQIANKNCQQFFLSKNNFFDFSFLDKSSVIKISDFSTSDFPYEEEILKIFEGILAQNYLFGEIIIFFEGFFNKKNSLNGHGDEDFEDFSWKKKLEIFKEKAQNMKLGK